jgi:hypothetical protein
VVLPDYDLHKLGWQAFQDLSAIVLQTVLGQTFHTFADGNDAGQDGAFHGCWRTGQTASDESLGPLTAGVATVVQCKFSARSEGTLTPSILSAELDKVELLHNRGVCDAYLVMTNLRVTGNTAAWLAEETGKRGVAQSLVLDRRWISEQISKSPELRKYVPRVYGLGDLSLILDERRLRQAKSLMNRLEHDLVTFVPTDAYRRAANALSQHNFVLLLGEPACGKSTIAATLAVAALDSWGCDVQRVDSAEELIAAWNPDTPNQLFWIDDAFGSIRHEVVLTDGWARRMDQVMTAVQGGARVVLTSRDYIYREARPHLKDYAHPRLAEQQVVVDVTKLSLAEKRQILYNHLKAGDQPRRVLETWRPNLHHAAAVERFEPEVARRLAHSAFTQGAHLYTADHLTAFFARPVRFLCDVIRQLDAGSRAAMACTYLSGNELPAPVQFSHSLLDAVKRLGASETDVLTAFQRLDGTFLQAAMDTHGDPVWRFRHPTIREAFAAVIAEDVNAVAVFVDGLSNEELLLQVECGGPVSRGTLVRVPSSLYDRVVPRVCVPESGGHSPWSSPIGPFLEKRCSPAFLSKWAAYHAGDLPSLLSFGLQVDAYWQPRVSAASTR